MDYEDRLEDICLSFENKEENPDFIKLCLNKSIVPEITLQPLQRFDFDAAIIFSDILMLPYGMGQNVKFTKGFGPSLNRISIELMKSVNKDDFINKQIQFINL